MEEKEYIRTFRSVVNIAKNMFVELPNLEEGMEWAEHAVHVAILTHNEELGSLSTHVHYIARQYKNQFIRQTNKWEGTRPRVKKSVQNKYTSVHKHVEIHRKHSQATRLPQIDIYANDEKIDLRLDIKSIIEKLERKHHIIGGRLSVIAEELMTGSTTTGIAKQLGCSRQWVSRLKRLLKKKLEHYLKEK
jgi:hypothetical protein